MLALFPTHPMIRRHLSISLAATALAALLTQPGCGNVEVAVPSPKAAAPVVGGGSESSPARRPQIAKLSFNENIQPILSENCYACHGPDPGSRKAELRLDRAEYAFAPRKEGGTVIVRGDPDHSPLVRRVESKDVKEMMPPPEAHKTLKPEQVTLLREWVKQGAIRRALGVHHAEAFFVAGPDEISGLVSQSHRPLHRGSVGAGGPGAFA